MSTSQEPQKHPTMMNGDSGGCSYGAQPQGSLADEDKEISLINPFASSGRSRVRQRGVTAQHTQMNATFMSVDRISAFGDDGTSQASATMSSSHHAPLHMAATKPPGTAGFLEIEEELDEDLLGLEAPQQVKTTSGLFLTHRQTPSTKTTNMNRSRPYEGRNNSNNDSFRTVPGTPVNMNTFGGAFEVESGGFGNPQYSSLSAREANALVKAKRWLSYMRVWNAVCIFFLIIGTGAILHSIRHERASSTPQKTSEESLYNLNADAHKVQAAATKQDSEITQQILLLPLPNATLQHHRRTMQVPEPPVAASVKDHGIRQSLHELRQEFEEWIQTHNKVYSSQDEKERRFQIWHDNHHKTIEKNKRHGPCKLTGKPVFGSTHFKDLTTEEFTSQYLTGYKGPHTDQLHGSPKHHRRMANEFGSVPGTKERAQTRSSPPFHSSVHERYLQNWEIASHDPYQSSGCSFYDVSCWLQWFVYTYASGIGGTMEPQYDGDTYPEAIDWRDYGCVSDVHSQGSCGACWAITAVETIESAYALNQGTLIDLSETEVIVCEDTCEMCNGGWPQNAYDFDMDNNGLLPENSWSYDGDFLYALTASQDGESENYDASYVSDYRSSVCSDGSGTRYAKIKGYGYATDRCVCYTDGTGCDCDEQNELKALQNVATYGPATVCLEASTWADYAGGILTSDSGCSPAFLDMNHCVQAVGYAFIDSDGDDAADDDGSGSGSNSHSGSGSRDDGNREGYWIIRNQWSSYWGYNGFIYVAMGDNTCGVLNDMTQVYM